MIKYCTDLINQPDELVIQSDHVLLLAGFTRRVDVVGGRVAPGGSGAAGGVGLAAVVSSFRHPAAWNCTLKTGGLKTGRCPQRSGSPAFKGGQGPPLTSPHLCTRPIQRGQVSGIIKHLHEILDFPLCASLSRRGEPMASVGGRIGA